MGSDLDREGEKKIKSLLCLERKSVKTDSEINMEGSKGSENRGFFYEKLILMVIKQAVSLLR